MAHNPDECGKIIFYEYRCPICKRRPIYYFKCDHGSRVIFESKGPVWKKHECEEAVIMIRKFKKMGYTDMKIRKFIFDEANKRDKEISEKSMQIIDTYLTQHSLFDDI